MYSQLSRQSHSPWYIPRPRSLFGPPPFNIFGNSTRRFHDQRPQLPAFTRPVFKADASPLWTPPPPRKRYGPKQLNVDVKLNFNSKLDSGLGRQRARRLRRQQPKAERRRALREDRGQLGHLDEEIHQEIGSNILGVEDQILLKQMAALNIDRALRTKLVAARETVTHAAEQTATRVEKQAERDFAVKQQIEEELAQAKQKELRREQIRLEDEQRKRDLLQQQENERRERQRIRKLQEQEARRREEARREERRRQDLFEKQENERRERERLRRLQEKEARRREEEERQYTAQWEEARLRARERLQAMKRELANETTVDPQFALYDEKWAHLRAGLPVRVEGIAFTEVPWPVLGPKVTLPVEITYERVYDFVFHSLRKGVEGKSRRDRLRLEVLKWHPDKFNTMVLPKIAEKERQSADEGAGVVARILNQMSEEIQTENQGM